MATGWPRMSVQYERKSESCSVSQPVGRETVYESYCYLNTALIRGLEL